MDQKFIAAQSAVLSDDAEELERLVRADPSLVCCLVLEMPPRRSLEHLIRLLAQFGAELSGPLGAAACIDNVKAVETLLDLGAPIAGDGKWSPLEEALDWGHGTTVELLLKRGAPVDNLRKYAALGDAQGVKRCFDANGDLNQEAGDVAWPFGSTLPASIRRDRRQIINNALVFAAAWGRKETAVELLKWGAEINAIPAGFDFAGSRFITRP